MNPALGRSVIVYATLIVRVAENGFRPDPLDKPFQNQYNNCGPVAQLGEHSACTGEVCEFDPRRVHQLYFRKRAFEKYGKICNRCGYAQDEHMLEVDHILGRQISHKLEDIQVLCVWCHWMKTRNVTPHNWSGNLSEESNVNQYLSAWRFHSP